MGNPYCIGRSPDMRDPLSEAIALLQPRAVFSKRISGAGRWGVRYSEFGQPSFCAVLEGSCRLGGPGHRARGPVGGGAAGWRAGGRPARVLEAGVLVLLPATPGFTLSGFEPVRPDPIDPKV